MKTLCHEINIKEIEKNGKVIKIKDNVKFEVYSDNVGYHIIDYPKLRIKIMGYNLNKLEEILKDRIFELWYKYIYSEKNKDISFSDHIKELKLELENIIHEN